GDQHNLRRDWRSHQPPRRAHLEWNRPGRRHSVRHVHRTDPIWRTVGQSAISRMREPAGGGWSPGPKGPGDHPTMSDVRRAVARASSTSATPAELLERVAIRGDQARLYPERVG